MPRPWASVYTLPGPHGSGKEPTRLTGQMERGFHTRLAGHLSDFRQTEQVSQDHLAARRILTHKPQKVPDPFPVLPPLDVGRKALFRELLEGIARETVLVILIDTS